MTDEYIPSARNAIVAYFGRNAAGNLRTHCNSCIDKGHVLTDASKIHGDLYIPTGDRSLAEEDECCEVCGVALLALSRSCQQEHDEQQARWARASRVDHLLEYGIAGAVRCRVY